MRMGVPYRIAGRFLSPLTLCLFLASTPAVGKQQTPDLHPPAPSTCAACRPPRDGLPFDPPVKGIIVTYTGDIIASADYYVVDLGKKTVCHLDGRRYETPDDLIKNRACRKLTRDDFRTIVTEANFVWELSRHPRKRSKVYSTAPTFVQIFDHEHSYRASVVTLGPLPFSVGPREPEEGLIDSVIAAARPKREMDAAKKSP
jgi:hypothetical protein